MSGALKQSRALSRSFLFAVALHLVAAFGVIVAVKNWPAVAPRLRSALEVEVVTAPMASAPKPTGEQTWVSAATPEFRAPPALSVPVPAPGAVPDLADAPVVVPLVAPVTHPVAPDLAGEDTRAWVVLPVRPTAAPVASAANTSAVPGDGEGRPVALSELRPHYPDNARMLGQEGKVTVRLHVTSGGEVESAEIGRSSGFTDLDQSAVSAARRARFKPARQDGKPVSAVMDLQFEFRLKD